MTQIQSLLIIGGMTLLSILILTRGSNTITNISRTLHIEAVSAAHDIGQSVIEQINSVDFDEKVINENINDPAELSSFLSSDTGEYSFQIIYHDSSRTVLPTSILATSDAEEKIKSINLSLIYESQIKNNDSYQQAEWKKIIHPKNLN